MIKVYLEKPPTWAQELAVFQDESAYVAVADALETWAKNEDPDYIITECVEDDS
jgi:NADPH-dependent ferric siderophore reductase